MNSLEQIAIRIIKEQELIIGPLAWSEASKIKSLTINRSTATVSISGDAKEAINNLVSKFNRLFGQISHNVCREAAAPILASLRPDEIPSSLK
jgi:hypothetical protein